LPTLHEIFSWVCGQQNNWLVGGGELPFCQRCTGLYVGAIPALLLCLYFRPKATRRMLWVHGMLLLLMVPFGYHLVPQTAVIRMLTGQLFAIGLVYYLVLLVFDRWEGWRALTRIEEVVYFLIAGCTLLLSQMAVRWGGREAYTILSLMGVGGLLVYVALVAGSLVLLGEAFWKVLRGRVRQAES